MALDGLFLHKLLAEMEPSLLKAKINRVHQPGKNMILLKLNQYEKGNFSLLLTADPQNARCHITEHTRENPKTPPLFAMVLRKHIEGGKILALSQQGLDRVVEITVEGKNEIGEPALKKIFLEIMGKHSNIILTSENLEIIGALKQYGSNVSRYRQVMPHITYVPPPPQNKKNPLLITAEELYTTLLEGDINLPLAEALGKTLSGLSPQTIKEILYRSALTTTTVAEMGLYEGHKLHKALEEICRGEVKATITLQGNLAKDFYFLPFTHLDGETFYFDSLNEALDMFYQKKESDALFYSQKAELSRHLNHSWEKLVNKIKKQEKEWEKAGNGKEYKLYGELISAYLCQVPAHAEEVTLPNFYEAEAPLTIPLLPELTPQENAARYFRRYNKTKAAKDAIARHLQKNREELTYAENLCYSVESATSHQELNCISEEAIATGYLKNKTKEKIKKQKNQAFLPPLEFSFQGYTILIGRNNKDNDRLTFKIAAKHDIWLHTKDIPGSHVIIRCPQTGKIPNAVLLRAAQAAAYHSKAKEADKVPVDYTKVKEVKKPTGAKPGMVVYFDQTTLFVTPQKPDYINVK